MLAVAVPAFDSSISSSGNYQSRQLSSATRRPLWLATRPSIAIGGMAEADLPQAAPRMEVSDGREASVPSPTVPRLARRERIELAIDSLQNYELLKPIPVLVESLGDTVFVAEAPDLNVSTTGNSVGAAFLLLKEQIHASYEGSRAKKGSDADRARQLAVFEKFIGKPRRHWF